MAFLSFLVFLVLYAGAGFPSFGSDVGAELLAAASTNGVPPPPAQTLAWLLAKLSIAIPLGAPARTANFLAAALMAATVPWVADILERLSPPRERAPFAHQELEQDRWRATSRWLTAFLWGLSPGPWRCALSLGPETVGLFLVVLAFRAAAGAEGKSIFSRAPFLAALAVGQWPPALLAAPGLLLVRRAVSGEETPRFLSRRWTRGAAAAVAGIVLGLLPALAVVPLSLWAPLLDNRAPDGWAAWIRYAASCPPFFPPPAAAAPGFLKYWGLTVGALFTWPGAAVWGFGLTRLARNRSVRLPAALALAAAGPALFLFARPVPDGESAAQAALWGLCALGLAVPFLWGYHRTGVRFPLARTALAFLLPLSLAGRIPLAARGDLSLRDRADGVLAALPEGALLWDPAAPGAVFHAQFVEGRRRDVRVARRPGEPWARAEFRRRYPAPQSPSVFSMSKDFFFLEAAREAGTGRVFTDDPARLPEVDPATGLPTAGRFPEDALPWGAAMRFFPADSHRLVSPAAQLPVSRVSFWALPDGDPRGAARARWALAMKFDQYGLPRESEEESLAALAFDPSLPEANVRLAEIALSENRPPLAAVYLRRALRREPRRAGAWLLLATAERAAGKKTEAVKAARAALALDPLLEEARLLLAQVLEETGRPTAAAAEWKALMDRRPEERTYPWRLAKAEAAAGRPAKARSALREYLMFPLSDDEKAEAEALEKSLK